MSDYLEPTKLCISFLRFSSSTRLVFVLIHTPYAFLIFEVVMLYVLLLTSRRIRVHGLIYQLFPFFFPLKLTSWLAARKNKALFR